MSLSSCVKDSDIDSDYTIEPSSSITSDLVVASWNASSFVDLNQSEQFLADTTYLDMTNSTIFMDQLSKTNLSFKLNNSLEKEFNVEIKFLNDQDEVAFSLEIPLSSGTLENPISVETNVVIELPELTTFKEATKLLYKISLVSDNKILAPESDGKIKLLSDATYFY